MISLFKFILVVSLLINAVLPAPVDPKRESVTNEKRGNEEIDDYGLEYGRYLQQIVQALEEDKDFANKLANISSEDIKNGKIAHELQFVKHNIRSKLDELKRIEVDRLRKLVQEQMERTELGLYRDEDGRLLASSGSRRWRTIPGNPGAPSQGGGGGGDFWLGLDRKGVKLPSHLDIGNPHSFEISDLKKLIKTATRDLEDLDRQRREEFKKYEMEKELKYRDSLQNMTEQERKETEKHHKEMIEKHKDHPKVHHPGSKPQLEQVWEEEDQMPKEEFNPKTFFAMHDTNDDGHLDENEVEVILRPEVKKMYDVKNAEDDPAEMEEEYHRMREHIFNETDSNRDGLISMEEFLRMAAQQEFERDEGWKGIDEENIYSEDELQDYMKQRPVYHAPNSYQGIPPNYPAYHPEAQVYQGAPHQQQYPDVQPQYPSPQQYHPPPGHFPPPQQYLQPGGGPPQPQPQYLNGPPQQQYPNVPPPQRQQQQYPNVPPPQQQQHYPNVPPPQQQQHVNNARQQYQTGQAQPAVDSNAQQPNVKIVSSNNEMQPNADNQARSNVPSSPSKEQAPNVNY